MNNTYVDRGSWSDLFAVGNTRRLGLGVFRFKNNSIIPSPTYTLVGYFRLVGTVGRYSGFRGPFRAND